MCNFFATVLSQRTLLFNSANRLIVKIIMIKYSFILPCYNVAPYIGRCIDSIENQDIPRKEYELICVDDCSSDETVGVIREYQKKYSNIILICHTENRTAGGARNSGIKVAKGHYIWFVDPDDTIKPNVLNKLYIEAKQQNADILNFNIQVKLENGQVLECKVYDEQKETLSGPLFLEKHGISLHKVDSVYSGIYKCNFLKENKLKFPEIKSSQDVVFIWKCILKAKRYMSLSDICYLYIRRENSTTGNKGKFSAQTIFSQSLLYSIELNKILQTNTDIPQRINYEIHESQYSALNQKSRNVIYATKKGKKLFYKQMQRYKAEIDDLADIMNRKTRKIFSYSTPYVLWRLFLIIFALTNKYKKRPNNY